MDTERVYSLEELRMWGNDGNSLAVIGNPIAHSLSPKIHNAAINALQKLNPSVKNKQYFKFEISPENLSEAIELFYIKKFVGLNLTIPHKMQVLPLLSSISKDVELIGAANTLKFSTSGFCGENTDGKGFVAAVKSSLRCELKNRPVCLCGAGGAARAIAISVLLENISELRIFNRTKENAEFLVADLKKKFPDKVITAFSLDEIDLPELALIINATSLGLKKYDSSPVPFSALKNTHFIYDTTYGFHKSIFCKVASDLKIPNANGLSMLIWQAAYAFEYWFSVPANEVAYIMRQALEK